MPAAETAPSSSHELQLNLSLSNSNLQNFARAAKTTEAPHCAPCELYRRALERFQARLTLGPEVLSHSVLVTIVQ